MRGFMKNFKYKLKQKAFTLIEVMAAVAVFTISSVGMFSINQQNVLLADRLENKTLAHWVALNTFNRLDIEGDMPNVGTESDTEALAGIVWQVKTNIAQTELKRVRRITIKVNDGNGKQYASLVGFIGSRLPVLSGQ